MANNARTAAGKRKPDSRLAKPAPPPPVAPRLTEADLDAEAQRRARALSRKSAAGKENRDIAHVVHPPINPERYEAARLSFRAFCDSYFPQTFCLPWSPDHLKAIKHIEDAVLRGGLFAYAMPRGSGKTSLAECACVWALLYGHREFVCLIGSDEGAAELMLDSIKTELETNDLLEEDHASVVGPIRALEGIPHRAGGQLFKGERTHIGWTAKDVVLPTIPGSPGSGGVVMVRGITGRLRGMKFKMVDGRSVRPSLVVIDDPQTDESANSPSQCESREAVLSGAILGLAGPGKKIAGVMPCTVIRPGDMADRMLDRLAHPEWNGERSKLIYAWPTATALWEQYATLRAEGLREGDEGKRATEFYRGNRAVMDAGAQVAWPERFNVDELSALQNVMNLRLDRGDDAFFAEFQNDPIQTDVAQKSDLSADAVAARVSGIERYAVPSTAHHLTAFIDVQGKALFYVVCAWEDDFTGYVLDYGTWPDQRRPYYTLKDMKITMATQIKGAGLEGQITGALKALVGHLVGGIKWQRDDGAVASIERILIDANWGQSTEVVYEFCRRSEHAPILLASHGRFVGASSAPMSSWQRKRGDRNGHHWKIPVASRRETRHILIDANFWKTFLVERLSTAPGDPGALTLFGRDASSHRLIAEHCVSEYRVPVEGRGRRVDEWKIRPMGYENHFWDGLVGCAAAASVLGVSVGDAKGNAHAPAERRRLSDRSAATAPARASAPRAPTRPENRPAPQPQEAPSGGRMRLSDLAKMKRGG